MNVSEHDWVLAGLMKLGREGINEVKTVDTQRLRYVTDLFVQMGLARPIAKSHGKHRGRAHLGIHSAPHG